MAAGGRETGADARSRRRGRTRAVPGGMLRGMARKRRDGSGSLSANSRRIERQRDAGARITPRGMAGGTNLGRNQSEDKYDRSFMARPALRRTNAVQKSRLHVDCRHHAGARHWREYGRSEERRVGKEGE